MTKLWIAGGLSIGLVVILTVLGGTATGQPIWAFLMYTSILVGFMVLTARGHRWARWIVSLMLLFFAASALRAGGLVSIALAAVFAVSAGIFFMHRSETAV